MTDYEGSRLFGWGVWGIGIKPRYVFELVLED